jgi:predicted nicotinamide N-methyase
MATEWKVGSELADPNEEEQQNEDETHTDASTSTSLSVAEDHDDDSACYADMGFMFEGSQPTSIRRFQFPKRDGSAVQVVVRVVDDDPGAVQSGHYLWPAAQLLAEYMVSLPPPAVPVISVLELGAGCALAALTALQCWQPTLQCVVVTDHDPGTLQRARDNHESTIESIMDAATSEESLEQTINSLASIPVEFREYSWGTDPAPLTAVLGEHVNVKACDPSPTWFDLILGSDLIYDTAVVEPLFTTVAPLMARTSRFLLSQSFVYETVTEEEIQRVCELFGLTRTILLDDGQGERRIQEFTRGRQ